MWAKPHFRSMPTKHQMVNIIITTQGRKEIRISMGTPVPLFFARVGPTAYKRRGSLVMT